MILMYGGDIPLQELYSANTITWSRLPVHMINPLTACVEIMLLQSLIMPNLMIKLA